MATDDNEADGTIPGETGETSPRPWVLLYAGPIKRRDESFAGAGFFLYESVFDAAVKEVLFGLVVFFVRQGPVDFRVFAGPAAGDVLAHEAEQDLFRLEVVPYPVDDALCVVYVARQDEMADDDALLEHAVVVQDIGACLFVHGEDGTGCYVRIVPGTAVAFCHGGVHVFQVRQVNLDFAFEGPDRFYPFIAAAVVDDRYGKRLRQAFQDGPRIRRGGHEIDIVRSLGDEFVVDGLEPGHRDGNPFAIHADLGILAETAAQVAAGKKNRARSAAAADAWFFPEVQGCPCQHRLERAVAVAGKVRADAVAF